MKQIAFSFFLIIFFSCKVLPINGQEKISKQALNKYTEAKELIFTKKYESALSKLDESIKIEPTYNRAKLEKAKIYQVYLKDYQSASAIYSELISSGTNISTLHFNNALCLFNLKKYDIAKKNINHFLAFEDVNGLNKEKGKQLLNNIDFIQEQNQNIDPIKFINLGKSINSENDEYFPSLTSDQQTLYFTVQESSKYSNEDIYNASLIEGNYTTRKKLNQIINTNSNEGAHCISTSGKYLLFASDNYKNDNLGRMDIYISKKIGNKWQRPVNMGTNINSRYWDSQPVLSSDSKFLFFVSKRKDGIGGSDIYYSKLGADGKFEIAKNIGKEINTVFDEQRPYLHPDGKTLYFASAGHPGMGGSDLFKSILSEDGKWSKPSNLGPEVNTSSDEYGFFVSADSKTAFISSDREGGFGGKDIYSFTLPEEARPNLVSYIKGSVYGKINNTPIKANIKIYDITNNRLVKTLSSDEINGSFLTTIKGGLDYAFEVESKGYLPFSENISLKDLKHNESYIYEIILEKIEIGNEFVLKNIFFESGKHTLLDKSKIELDFFKIFIENNPSLKIEIAGHTDNIGSNESNLLLSKNRAQSVYNYLTENGISSDRLEYKGYGSSKPLVDNNSLENRATNRRTSFKITK